jgi:histidine triad (HIT) family protein
MKNCVFCKIVNGEISCHKIYENEYSLAFLDINPCADGHTLVIPKNHYETLEEIKVEELGPLFQAVQSAEKILKKALKFNAANIGFNNGSEAGQEVPHLHIHIIPRRRGDGGMPIQGLVRSAKEDLKEVAERIKSCA